MLVLERHIYESIVIGDDVIVTIESIRGDKVRLGTAAPAGLDIYRAELYAQIVADLKKGIPAPQQRKRENAGKLVLGRARDEQLMLIAKGDWLNPWAIITVCDVRGPKVKVGITAASTISIHRQEVYNEIRQELMHAHT